MGRRRSGQRARRRQHASGFAWRTRCDDRRLGLCNGADFDGRPCGANARNGRVAGQTRRLSWRQWRSFPVPRLLRDGVRGQSRPRPSSRRGARRDDLRQHLERPLLQVAPAARRIFSRLKEYQGRRPRRPRTTLRRDAAIGRHRRHRHRTLQRRAVRRGERPHPQIRSRPGRAGARRAADRRLVGPAAYRRSPDASLHHRRPGQPVRRPGHGDQCLPVGESHRRLARHRSLRREADARRDLALRRQQDRPGLLAG
jgi:hypothetical protein